MDEQDIETQIQTTDHLKFERQIITTNESGIPSTSTIKKGCVEPIVKKRITPEQQRVLNAAWEQRVITKRRLDDNEDVNLCTPLKKQYFAAIDNYKRLHQSIYGT